MKTTPTHYNHHRPHGVLFAALLGFTLLLANAWTVRAQTN